MDLSTKSDNNNARHQVACSYIICVPPLPEVNIIGAKQSSNRFGCVLIKKQCQYPFPKVLLVFILLKNKLAL